MDEYGCFRNNEKDYDELAHEFKQSGNIVFSYSYDGVGAMVINLNGTFKKLGVMPFGGQPNGRIYVGVYGVGCNHVNWDSDPYYIREKLRICLADAEGLSNLFKEMHRRL